MSSNKAYFAIFRKKTAMLNCAKKDNILEKEAKIRNTNVSDIPATDRFITVERNIKECFIVDNDKNVVAYGSVIRLPKDPNSNRFSEDLSLVRATCALQKNKTKMTRYNTTRLTNKVDFLDDETKSLIKKIKLEKRKPINFEEVAQLLASLMKNDKKVSV